MMKLTLSCIFFILSAQIVFAQAEVIKFDHLEKIIGTPSDKIQVINFWATWCAPCVKELPLFEKLQEERPDQVNVTLINLDYADKLDRVRSFVARKKMKAEVLLLDEIDYNTWIDKVDKSWSGAIPATLIIFPKTGHRKFVEKELVEGDLEKLIMEVQ
jgi:thiol-disulfide isomerase/thioredoxin